MEKRGGDRGIPRWHSNTNWWNPSVFLDQRSKGFILCFFSFRNETSWSRSSEIRRAKMLEHKPPLNTFCAEKEGPESLQMAQKEHRSYGTSSSAVAAWSPLLLTVQLLELNNNNHKNCSRSSHSAWKAFDNRPLHPSCHAAQEPTLNNAGVICDPPGSLLSY